MKFFWEFLVFLIFVFFMAAIISKRGQENYLADYDKYCHCRCPIEPQIPGQ
jgi:hypothetical protein